MAFIPETRTRLRRIVGLASPEAVFWVAALIYLACIVPERDDHITLCLYRAIGLGKCPGCGLGRSVSYLLHGNPAGSVQTHILGIPALLIILFRTATLLWRRSGTRFVIRPATHPDASDRPITSHT